MLPGKNLVATIILIIFARTDYVLVSGISTDYTQMRVNIGVDECGSLKEEKKKFEGSISHTRYGLMIALMNEDKICFCGASLLDDRHFLTAGHCVDYIQRRLDEGSIIEAWIAPTNLKKFQGQRIPVIQIQRHEDFSPRPVLHNDIAVGTLATAVKFNDHVSIVCLGVAKSYHGSAVTLMGFGQYDCHHPSEELRESKGHAMDVETCRRSKHRGNLTDQQICAKVFTADGDVGEQAPGDSGGPLILTDPLAQQGLRNYIQIGIVSYNFIKNGSKNFEGRLLDPCPNTLIPGTYTRVGAYMGFIRKAVPNVNLCL